MSARADAITVYKSLLLTPLTPHTWQTPDLFCCMCSGSFLISPTGVLRQITVNDLPVGRSVDETLRLVKAFQFTDVHGEVCPANWVPGAKTMKPDPVKSLDYFSTVN